MKSPFLIPNVQIALSYIYLSKPKPPHLNQNSLVNVGHWKKTKQNNTDNKGIAINIWLTHIFFSGMLTSVRIISFIWGEVGVGRRGQCGMWVKKLKVEKNKGPLPHPTLKNIYKRMVSFGGYWQKWYVLLVHHLSSYFK